MAKLAEQVEGADAVVADKQARLRTLHTVLDSFLPMEQKWRERLCLSRKTALRWLDSRSLECRRATRTL